MSTFGNHIIALDYRGYGDSTGVPTVNGVVHDVLHVFNVIRHVCPENPIAIWGHSMGTGVALWAMHNLFHNHTGIEEEFIFVLKLIFFSNRVKKTIRSCTRSPIL
jgi:alpha-beta hydrolase superfamily lysophospholipase